MRERYFKLTNSASRSKEHPVGKKNNRCVTIKMHTVRAILFPPKRKYFMVISRSEHLSLYIAWRWQSEAGYTKDCPNPGLFFLTYYPG